MPTFPLISEAPFRLAAKQRELRDILISKRERLEDELEAARIKNPPPMPRILELRDLLEAVNLQINQANDESLRLTFIAMQNILTNSDLEDPVAAINCSLDKVKLALDNLAQLRNALTITGLFLKLGSSMIAATMAGPIGFVQIVSIVQEIDATVNTELGAVLSQDELEALRSRLSVNCAKRV